MQYKCKVIWESNKTDRCLSSACTISANLIIINIIIIIFKFLKTSVLI